MPSGQLTDRHPFMSLLQLLLLVLGGTLLFTCLAFVIGILIYGFDGMVQFQQSLNGNSTEGLGFLKLVQIASTIGTFVVPALIFAKFRGSIISYLHLDKPVSWILIVVSIALMFSSSYLIEWTIGLNKQMHLPDFLKGVEVWMQNQEDQLTRLTKQLLIMNNMPDLLVNLLMIAILPALGEEFIFRGCFQNIFTRWTGNYHWGIWLAAILFSAIHMQFYGFIPRMLLGAMFGYMLVWGRSMWLPVLAHLINNGGAVITAYVLQRKGQSLDNFEEVQPTTWPIYVLSTIATVILLGYMYYSWKKNPDLNDEISL
jgi:membrane protease YdiL (CAAX protease family)